MIGLDLIFGGITGLVGSAITSIFKYKNLKIENSHIEKMVGLTSDAMVKKGQMDIQINKAKIAGKIDLADIASFDTSQEIGSKKLFHEKWIDMIMEAGKTPKWYGWIFKIFGVFIASSFAFVDWLNSFMRPALTIYLMGTSTWITILSWKIMQQHGIEISSTQAVGIFSQVTSTMIYLTVSAIVWWFGDRSLSKFLQQQSNKKEGKK